ncbi:MAG: cadherin-like domain-containing protein, partial [Thermoplasmata archaeon]|nr:cadherin-like domain-containing protein [Thermoplasmata archaeon]
TYSFFIFAIDEHDNKNKSSTFSFEIKNSPPNKPKNIYPENGATGIELNPILRWNCTDVNGDEITYDVYFGKEGNINKIVSNITTDFFDISSANLERLTTYYWYVVAWDEHKAKNKSQIWYFTTKGNAPPVAVEDDDVVNENGSILIDVLANDYDIDGDVLSIVSVSNPSHGRASVEGRKVFYEPDKNFYGEDEFLYTITDGFVEVSAKINVVVNALPVADFDYLPASPSPNMLINFTDKSYDKDGSITNHTWVIDGKKFYENKISYSFDKEGN